MYKQYIIYVPSSSNGGVEIVTGMPGLPGVLGM